MQQNEQGTVAKIYNVERHSDSDLLLSSVVDYLLLECILIFENRGHSIVLMNFHAKISMQPSISNPLNDAMSL